MAQIESGRRVENSHIWQREEHEHYVEETWCSRRLFCVEKFQGRIVDPACGFGRVVKSASLAGYSAAGADVVQRAPGYPVHDFFQSSELTDNFVSNPPFKQFQAFALHALACSTRKVALIWQVPRLNAARWLQDTPLARIWLLTPRPSMPPGCVISHGVGLHGEPQKVGGGTQDYAWLVWDKTHVGPPTIGWLHRDPSAWDKMWEAPFATPDSGARG